MPHPSTGSLRTGAEPRRPLARPGVAETTALDPVQSTIQLGFKVLTACALCFGILCRWSARFWFPQSPKVPRKPAELEQPPSPNRYKSPFWVRDRAGRSLRARPGHGDRGNPKSRGRGDSQGSGCRLSELQVPLPDASDGLNFFGRQNGFAQFKRHP